MTYKEAVENFKRDYVELYINHADYGRAFEAWDYYTDALCKSGQITDRQWNTWSTPFPYGKSLKPSKKQLERWVYEKDM